MQATSYASYIQKLLGNTDIDLKPKTIASLSQDCSKWRKLVVACSAAEWWCWWTVVVIKQCLLLFTKIKTWNISGIAYYDIGPGVLKFGLGGSVRLTPQNPYPFLGICSRKFKTGPVFRDFPAHKSYPCLGLLCKKVTRLSGTSP